MSTHAVGSLNQGATQCYQAFLVLKSCEWFCKWSQAKLWDPSQSFHLQVQKAKGDLRALPYSMFKKLAPEQDGKTFTVEMFVVCLLKLNARNLQVR